MDKKGHLIGWILLLAVTVSAAWVLWNTSPMLNPNLPAADPSVEIAKLLSSGKGAAESTPDIVFEKDRVVSSKDFNGYSPRSVVFDRDSTAADFVSVGVLNENGQKSPYVKNSGPKRFRARAMVICAINGNDLEPIIESYKGVNSNYAGMINPVEICGSSEYQPCCLVVIRAA